MSINKLSNGYLCQAIKSWQQRFLNMKISIRVNLKLLPSLPILIMTELLLIIKPNKNTPDAEHRGIYQISSSARKYKILLLYFAHLMSLIKTKHNHHIYGIQVLYSRILQETTQKSYDSDLPASNHNHLSFLL